MDTETLVKLARGNDQTIGGEFYRIAASASSKSPCAIQGVVEAGLCAMFFEGREPALTVASGLSVEDSLKTQKRLVGAVYLLPFTWQSYLINNGRRRILLGINELSRH